MIATMTLALFALTPNAVSLDVAPQLVDVHDSNDAYTMPVSSSGEMPGMMDRFFSFSVNDDAAPEVKDALVLTVVMNMFLPFGGVWGPMLLIDNAPSINKDIIISWLVPSLVGGLTSACLIGIPIALCAAPVASLNAYDRAMKSGRSHKTSSVYVQSFQGRGLSAPQSAAQAPTRASTRAQVMAY